MSQDRRKSKKSSLSLARRNDVGCIGRDLELLRLGACLDRLEGGQGAFAAVSAPAGVGKTRLLDAFAATADTSGRILLHVRLQPGAPRPYELWRQAVDSLAAQGIRSPGEMTPVYRVVLERLEHPHSSASEGRSRLLVLPAEQMRYRLYDAVWQLLRSVSRRKPLVVLIDDLQFADAPALKLLRHVLAFCRSAPILLVGACDDSEPAWTVLAQLRGAVPRDLPFEHIVLGGLSPLAVRELLQTAGMKNVASAPSGEIAELTRGSPLHVHLLVQLLSTQDPVPRSGACDNSVRELSLPASSADRAFANIVLTSLPSEERDVLQAAAIYPGTFGAAEVAALTASDPATAARTLKHLGDRGFLVPGNDVDNCYCFSHHIYRARMLDTLDPYERSRLTERALGLASRPHAKEADLWQLADWSHALRTPATARAGQAYCRQAAEQACQLSAPELSAHYLAKAVDLMDAAGKRDFALLRDQALAAADMGNFEEAARAAWGALDALGEGSRAKSQRLDALVGFAIHLHDSGAAPHLWETFRDKATASLADTKDVRWARLRLLDGGNMQNISGPPLQVGRWLGLDPQAVELIRQDGNEHDYCRTLFVYDWHGVEDIDALLARAEKWTSTANIARALSVAAETLMYRHGAFDRACELLEQQRRLHEQTGSIVEQAKSLVRLSMGLLAAGELEKAIATRDRARDMVDRLGPGYLIYEHAGTTRGGDLYPEISMESNFAWYIDGDWLAVAEHWAHAIGLKEPNGSPVHIVETAMAAQAYARIYRFEDARFYLDELTIVLRKLQPRDWAFNGAVGRASHAIWDMAAVEYAEEYRNHALHMLAAGVGDWTNTSLEQTVARMAALLDHGEEAATYFEAARQKLSRKRADPRKAIMDFDEAVSLRLLKSTNLSRRTSLLERAHTTFERRKMAGWSRRLKEEVLRS
jgi:tetratricopeptide (TPR) repeat protein